MATSSSHNRIIHCTVAAAAIAGTLLSTRTPPTPAQALTLPDSLRYGPVRTIREPPVRDGRPFPWIPMGRWVAQKRRPHLSEFRIEGQLVGPVVNLRLTRGYSTAKGWTGEFRLQEELELDPFVLLEAPASEADAPTVMTQAGAVTLPRVDLAPAGEFFTRSTQLRGLADGLNRNHRHITIDLGALPIARLNLDVTVGPQVSESDLELPAGASATPTKEGWLRVRGSWERIAPASVLRLGWREALPNAPAVRGYGNVELAEKWEPVYGASSGRYFLASPRRTDRDPHHPLDFDLLALLDRWAALSPGALSDDRPRLSVPEPKWFSPAGLREQCFTQQALFAATLDRVPARDCDGGLCRLLAFRPNLGQVAFPPLLPPAPGVRLIQHRRLRRAIPRTRQEWIAARELLPHLAAEGSLSALPACPGFGAAGSEHFLVLGSGEVLCLIHGHYAIDRSNARKVGAHASPRRQLRAFGVRDPRLLEIAADQLAP